MFDLFKIGFINFTITDFIDVFLVSIIIAGIYYALKNTIALKILFGLIILIFLSFFTEALNLKTLNWIIKTILNIWLLGFIILFQPEIRKALVMLTKSPIFQLFVKTKINQTLDVIVEAVKELSAKHIGALIVFPKTQNVQMTIDTGIPIQAVISKELILAIFNTKAPLHDGAIIVENQTIVAARCILPLSNISKYKNQNLGTRHRAALGLSEQVDAVILIVSEETGWITIAYKGELTINIKIEDLAIVLNDFLSNIK
ncbi:MAG: diadenylate cyclase CdaA [Candidatus Kapaibacteriota bacterium]